MDRKESSQGERKQTPKIPQNGMRGEKTVYELTITTHEDVSGLPNQETAALILIRPARRRVERGFPTETSPFSLHLIQ